MREHGVSSDDCEIHKTDVLWNEKREVQHLRTDVRLERGKPHRITAKAKMDEAPMRKGKMCARHPEDTTVKQGPQRGTRRFTTWGWESEWGEE